MSKVHEISKAYVANKEGISFASHSVELFSNSNRHADVVSDTVWHNIIYKNGLKDIRELKTIIPPAVRFLPRREVWHNVTIGGVVQSLKMSLEEAQNNKLSGVLKNKNITKLYMSLQWALWSKSKKRKRKGEMWHAGPAGADPGSRNATLPKHCSAEKQCQLHSNCFAHFKALKHLNQHSCWLTSYSSV